MKPKTSTVQTCRKLAEHDWRSEFERHDDPVDFLVRFLEIALTALSHATKDPKLRLVQRTAASYAISSAIRKAARMAETSLSENHEALPDIGLQEAIADAVDALHRIAANNRAALKNMAYSRRWPVNLAADGKPFESCVLLHDLAPATLGSKTTGFVPKPNVKRPPAVGGKWNALALQMRERTGLAQIPLRPPCGKNIKLWVEWQTAEKELERSKANILSRPEIKRWKSGNRVSGLKPGAVWSELKNEVKKALLTLAKNNALADG